MLKLLVKLIDETVVFPYRFNFLTNILSPYLKGSKLVLDVGASEGRLASSIKNRTNIDFIGVDTLVQPNGPLLVKKYNGKKLHFKDNSFDCVMLIDVLHHTKNPLSLIREAKRVTKKFIVIKDHYWNNSYDFTMLKMADWFGNSPYGVNLPYNYLNMHTWKAIFKEVHLSVVKSEGFSYGWFDQCKHIIFKLEKKSN